ncbi:MAG: hypothetical protein HYU52_09260 [Acidobacteria bacterium]|nr:hypothetical protein [Acidobacteriota bacterium]
MSVSVRSLTLAILAVAMLAVSLPALAHCDALDGPVVVEARAALEAGAVTPLLKWVAPGDEPAIRKAFEQTRAVRGKGSDARELADAYFFETLVRIHRASEGEAFSGLKPAGQDLGPAIRGGDQALESGSVDELEALLVKEVREGIRAKFQAAVETKQHASHNADAGRRWVHSYATFLHYADGIHRAATTGGHGAAEEHAPAHAAPKHEH